MTLTTALLLAWVPTLLVCATAYAARKADERRRREQRRRDFEIVRRMIARNRRRGR